MQQYVNTELQRIVAMIDKLASRVVQLERNVDMDAQNGVSERSGSDSGSGSLQIDANGTSFAEIVSQTENMQTQVAEISAAVRNQQKFIEKNDRERRDKNVVIIGLTEEDSERTETLVSDLFENRLSLSNVSVHKVTRLGKKNGERKSPPRPVLVTFESIEDKRKVLSAKSKLSGSKVFINNDMTKDQQNTERELRKKKQFLIKHPQYKTKRVTIYKGKLWADRIMVTDEDIHSAGYLLASATNSQQ